MSDRHPLEQRIDELERRLKQLQYAQRTTDRHVSAIENSRIYRILGAVGGRLLAAGSRIERWSFRLPFSNRWRRRPSDTASYPGWAAQQPRALPPPPATTPLISILVCFSAATQTWARDAVGSIRKQSYVNWELCVCPAGEIDPVLSEHLAEIACSDPRIRIVRTVGASAAPMINEIASLTRGDYLIILDPATHLDVDALAFIAGQTPADLVYTDEDIVDERGRPFAPVFKPGWSPDLLLSAMYLGQTFAVSRLAWERHQGVRPEFEGALQYDLALRITDNAATVRHVSRVLAHSRRPDPQAHENAASRRALEDALRRRRTHAAIEFSAAPPRHALRRKARGGSVSLIVCSRSAHLLDQCLSSVAARTAYPNREVIVVQHLGWDDAALNAVVRRHAAKAVSYAGPFDFARMNNLGAGQATGEFLVFLNDDVTTIEPSWLDSLVAQVERPDVGVAGARLLYPSGTLQHGGIAIGIGDGCGHIGRGSHSAPFWPWLDMTRDVAAVTGACLAIKAALFRELEGFDESFPVNYNDTDLCLRVRRAGYRVIYESGAVLDHAECQTRRGIVTAHERALWYERWAEFIDAGDPFYSPHLTLEREDLSLRSDS